MQKYGASLKTTRMEAAVAFMGAIPPGTFVATTMSTAEHPLFTWANTHLVIKEPHIQVQALNPLEVK